MSTRLTVFRATLVQDSALSVSGVDRESSADQSFALVDNVPTLVGRGLKGAIVAMARRFFDPLPRSVSEDAGRRAAYRRSAWEFADAQPAAPTTRLRVRAGVGIRHQTAARASGVLYDREVIPAGTRWPLVFRVDASHAGVEAEEAEGILGYVLARHWSEGRCWLGGGAARGLGWCHIEGLRAFRLDPVAYERWVESGRQTLPDQLPDVPIVEPTRSWCFRTLDVDIAFGEYRPEGDGPAWGLDMLAVGSHEAEQGTQLTGNGAWARPGWASASEPTPDAFSTDRAILMDGDGPLLPGSGVRGPMRHAFSRAENAAGRAVKDPHEFQGDVGTEDGGGRLFGTVANSSRILIRDARVEGEWAAARLQMHAEDEFSAGSYGSAKRDAVRLLRGVFPVRIVVEGPDLAEVESLGAAVDRLVALGGLGHLPLGGHKTRGAGRGRWRPRGWVIDDVRKARTWTPPMEERVPGADRTPSTGVDAGASNDRETTSVRVTHGSLDVRFPKLRELSRLARAALGGQRALVAWWCDPAIDLGRAEPPATFGRAWPEGEDPRIDEVAFFAADAVWRAARTVAGAQWVLIEEVSPEEPEALPADVVCTSARLHGSMRFAAADTGRGRVLLREWYVGSEILGFTLQREVL